MIEFFGLLPALDMKKENRCSVDECKIKVNDFCEAALPEEELTQTTHYHRLADVLTEFTFLVYTKHVVTRSCTHNRTENLFCCSTAHGQSYKNTTRIKFNKQYTVT